MEGNKWISKWRERKIKAERGTKREKERRKRESKIFGIAGGFVTARLES